MTARRFTSNRLSRRDALRLMGGAGAAAAIAGHGPPRAAFAQDTPAVTIEIPDSGAPLPTEDVTFRWIDPGDQAIVFAEAFFGAYEEARPNVTVQYDPLPWNDIAQVVPLGVQNGNAHDIFYLPLGVPSAQAVQEGWVAALDDVVPNFEEFKARFPPGVLVNGVNVFDGRTYGIPRTSNKRLIDLLLYNTEYMEQAGYDPATTPLTWDDFREAARLITEAGQGQYYGMIIGGNQVAQWANWVNALASMAGAAGGTMDWRTGQYNHASDQHQAAVELLLAIRDDGSVFPGVESMNAPQARATIAQGAAGMILQGAWNIPQWQRENPDFSFGVAINPLPNSGEPLPISYGPGGSDVMWVYAESDLHAVAGDMLNYLGSVDGQAAWAAVMGSGNPPVISEALDEVDFGPLDRTALDLYDQYMRLAPSPQVRNPETAQVFIEMQTLTPDFGEVIQGIFTGQLEDPQAALQDMQDRSEAELERAIAAAQANGAQVSRDDWVFPNWDPTQDYTDANYAELSG